MSSNFHDKRIALVTDWMTAPGGADRLIISLSKVFPNSDIYTGLYFEEHYNGRYKINSTVNQSFLSKLPFSRKLSRHFNLLSPIAFESFDFSGYDLVISLSSGPAKGIITSPDQRHIGIILTPPRSLWDRETNYRGAKFRSIYKVLSPIISNYLRIWDQTAMKRVDHLVSISSYIKQKVSKTYRRDSEVIYPGLSNYWFEVEERELSKFDLPKKYFLVVSRLYDYKRVDWAIRAAQKAKKSLVVVGEGPDRKYLQNLAGDETKFLGWIEDDDVRALYQKAEALLFCGIEDFGYVPVEAMATGCPVLAYNEGGVTESVSKGVSGEFFSSISQLVVLLEGFTKGDWDSSKIRLHAKTFSDQKFEEKFIQFLRKVNAI